MSYEDIKGLPGGARFFKCALQVNTYEYQVRHGKQTVFATEAEYNAAIVAACLAEGIEVVGVADHYRIQEGRELIAALRAVGISVFPGFEAVSKDGVHFLVLFDPSVSIEAIQGFIHECGVHDPGSGSVPGKFDATALLELAAGWGAQVIAAHCTNAGGLFQVLKGQPRAAVFCHDDLNACAIPGAVAGTELGVQRMLQNKEPEYERQRPIAVINAADVNSPGDVAMPGATTNIRMDAPTIEGLRQAFLDHDSRIRLNSDAPPARHSEIVGMEVESQGFLKDLKVHFNEGLNVLIGGRGAGKSALIECLRYAMDVKPLGEAAREAHEAIIKKVVKSGTRITVYVRTFSPGERWYRVERVVGQGGSRVFDQDGIEAHRTALELLGGLNVYGQSELAELARDPTKIRELLERFVETDEAAEEEAASLLERLGQAQSRLIAIEKETKELRERQAPLPGILDTLALYKEHGVEEKLSEQAAVVKAESRVNVARARLQPFSRLIAQARAQLPIPKAEFQAGNIEGLAAPDALAELHGALSDADKEIGAALDQIEAALTAAAGRIDTSSEELAAVKAEAAGRYAEALRELQTESIDGADFMRLREAVEKLEPLAGDIERLEAEAKALKEQRASDLAQLTECRDKHLTLLETTAKRVTKELDGLKVTVVRGQDRRELVALIDSLPGRFAETTRVLEAVEELDVVDFAKVCREGPLELEAKFKLTPLQAQRLCETGEAFLMALEQVELQPATKIEFNIAPPKSPAIWKELPNLSVGQKATALLYLLMLDSVGPLVLDQPEDNLDNRFVSEGIVPKIRGEKRKRQLIFATHNANIPVLGDAEQIISIDAQGEAEGGRIRIEPGHTGAIDSAAIATDIKQILEGGPDAFQTRRLKYGF